MSDNEYDDLGIAAIWELDPPTPPISPRDHDDDSATSGAAAAAAASSATSSPVEHAPKAASKTGAKQSTAKEPVLAIVKMPSLMEVSHYFGMITFGYFVANVDVHFVHIHFVHIHHQIPIVFQLSLRTLSEHPDQIIDLRFVDIHLCEFLVRPYIPFVDVVHLIFSYPSNPPTITVRSTLNVLTMKYKSTIMHSP